ncbi:hypothetical protein GYA19_03745 [Candidatus Beckwithbacteria bacterium]|nr:hypothetical protein [Candidatus Beckwithbacteria bacterium]
MIGHLLLYLFSFVGIWIGTGMAIKSIEKLCRSLKLSSFAISFLVLGLFTSISEFSVGVNAVIDQDPEIYIGNLIGASIVIFMLIIPLLAITGNSLKINKEFRGFNLIMSLVVISLPVILALDGKVDKIDSFISITFFIFLVIFIQTKKGLLEKISNMKQFKRPKIKKEILKICVSVLIIFVASHFIVEQTEYFSDIFKISSFLMSLLFIAIGTNLPELSFVVRSIFTKNNQVAFGDYVGSASFNTFIFGFLTLLYGKSVFLTNSYLISLTFMIIGLISFYFFSRSKNTLSKTEGLILLSIYFLFLFFEFFLH